MSTRRDKVQGEVFLTWCEAGNMEKIIDFQTKEPEAFKRAVQFVNEFGGTGLLV